MVAIISQDMMPSSYFGFILATVTEDWLFREKKMEGVGGAAEE